MICIILQTSIAWASLLAQFVKNPPVIRETWVWSLGWEDPLEKGKALHSSILAWRFRPWGHKESDMTEWHSLSKVLLSLRMVKHFRGDHCFEKSHIVYPTEKGQYYSTWQNFVWVEMHHLFILKDYELIWSIYGYWWYDYCTRIKNSELWWTVAWKPFSLVFVVLSNSFLRHKPNKEWKKRELFMDCCVKEKRTFYGLLCNKTNGPSQSPQGW